MDEINIIALKESVLEDNDQDARALREELKARGTISTSFGEDLSWEYLNFVREHPVKWNVPTNILYGSRDELTSYDTISAFSEKHGAKLTVMENGEHWFHTEEQMRFLDTWIRTCSFK